MIACENLLFHRFRPFLAVLLMFGSVSSVDAQVVFRCRDAHGHIAYQDHACVSREQQTEIEIAKAPPPLPSPTYGLSGKGVSSSRRAPSQRLTRGGSPAHREALSFECRASNGDVFYRHAACPKSINSDGGPSRGRSARNKNAAAISVAATPVTRAEACRRLAEAGAAGRAGRQHDEQVSTYDRNAGRDPCRRS